MLVISRFARKHYLAIVQIVLALIIGGYVMGAVTAVRDFFFPESGAYVRSTRTILHGIRGFGQLVTVAVEVAKADIRVEVNEGFLNYGHYSASHVAVGVIEAGIDITAIGQSNVRFDSANDLYHISLPPPLITSCRIEYIDQYGASVTLLPADWDVIRQLAQYEALTEFKRDALESGILERAGEEAALRIGDFIRAITGKPANVDSLGATSDESSPQSCEPEPPQGWNKEEGESGWKKE
ncbi:MAG: DUF4230 domain-containing protein [Chloroflexota bacterium]|nr:DUF4230 domain-containing protein [Chloroflexota bacterium]